MFYIHISIFLIAQREWNKLIIIIIIISTLAQLWSRRHIHARVCQDGYTLKTVDIAQDERGSWASDSLLLQESLLFLMNKLNMLIIRHNMDIITSNVVSISFVKDTLATYILSRGHFL